MFFFIEYFFITTSYWFLHLSEKKEYLVKKRRGTRECIVLQYDSQTTHYKQDPIYVFPEMKLHSLVLNFHIHVSVSDLYIPMIGPHISCSRIDRPIVGIYKSLTDTWMWKLGTKPHSFISGISNFRYSVFTVQGNPWKSWNQYPTFPADYTNLILMGSSVLSSCD